MLRNILYKGFSLIGSREVQHFENDSRNCEVSQLRKLLQIIKANDGTEYGKKFSFRTIKSLSDFQSAVPIVDYDLLSPHIEKIASGQPNILTCEPVMMFATTSGTTGSRKLIPVTQAYLKEFRTASVLSGYQMLRHFPGLDKGVTLSVFSPAEEGRTEGGIPYGAISGLLYLKEPALIRKFIAPIPYEVFLLEDYESRYYTLLRCALGLPLSCIYTLNPSTIALLGRRLRLYAESLIDDLANGTLNPPTQLPKNITCAVKPFLAPNLAKSRVLRELSASGQLTADKIWPTLSLISCWTKAAASFYLQDLPPFFGSVPICDITYGASEGRGTVFISPEYQALSIRSHFFEFVETEKMDKGEQRALAAWQLETGKEYYILFTTSAGLYRYHINDIVKVVGWYNRTPCLEFLHKGGNISSFTGEKLTESQVTQAATESAHIEKISLRFFTVVPEFRPEPHYQLWLEPPRDLTETELARIGTRFEECLGKYNSEYKVKRASHRLGPAQALQLAVNSYEKLRRDLVAKGTPDAQVKIPHLNPKDELKAKLRDQIRLVALSINSVGDRKSSY